MVEPPLTEIAVFCRRGLTPVESAPSSRARTSEPDMGCSSPDRLKLCSEAIASAAASSFSSAPGLFSAGRSEEHTSELQSLMRISYAVFCLKKKKKKLNSNTTTNSINHTHTNTSRLLLNYI